MFHSFLLPTSLKHLPLAAALPAVTKNPNPPPLISVLSFLPPFNPPSGHTKAVSGPWGFSKDHLSVTADLERSHHTCCVFFCLWLLRLSRIKLYINISLLSDWSLAFFPLLHPLLKKKIKINNYKYHQSASNFALI